MQKTLLQEHAVNELKYLLELQSSTYDTTISSWSSSVITSGQVVTGLFNCIDAIQSTEDSYLLNRLYQEFVELFLELQQDPLAEIKFSQIKDFQEGEEVENVVSICKGFYNIFITQDNARAVEEFKCVTQTSHNKRLLALAYHGSGRALESLSQFAKALQAYSFVVDVLLPNFAWSYCERGYLRSSLSDYNKAVLVYPDNHQILFCRGLLYEKQGKFEQALDDYCKSTESNPSFIEAHYHKAAMLLKLNKVEEAIRCYDQTITAKPNDSNVYFNRAVFFEGLQGKVLEALIDYSTAIKLNPQLVQAYKNRASIYCYLQQDNKALQDLQTAQRLVE